MLECRRLLAAQVVDIADPVEFADVWTHVDEIDQVQYAESNHVRATDLRRFALNRELLQARLEQAPPELANRRDSATIMLPAPSGEMHEFRIFDSPVMAPALAAKFPDIQTYSGQGVTDPAATLRLDLSPAGLHAQVLSPQGGYYIDPYYHLNDSLYATYSRADAIARPKRELVPHDRHPLEDLGQTQATKSPGAIPNRSGTQLRTYRTAVAATGEYTTFHGGTVSLGQAAIVTAINRVTGIYEHELSIRLELVANNNLLVYTDGGTDPYTNNDGVTMLGENQTNIDTLIGNANYDLGHVFSTGGGGIAELRSVGINGSKAEGVTGSDVPVGDPFWVDFVAHEIGHQFGGDHTWTGDSGSCGPFDFAAATAMEPGSGSTIQAYAGICGDDDLQPNSDPYFHSISFDQIIDYVDNVIPHIGTRTATGNSVPTASAGADFTIPARTPFILTGSGADADSGDVLTYGWEQRDAGPRQDLGSGDTVDNPLFRSFLPTTDPTRIFPQLHSLLNNTTTVGETLPTTSRDLNFRLTVRDNRAGGGGVNTDDMVVSVVNTGTPFAVTFPNGGETFAGASVQTITWDEAGTTGLGIDTANVNILLSTDGGATFPIVLADAVTNDGSHDVVLPDVFTTQARIKVEGDNNIFFDISDDPFSIGVSPALVCTPLEDFDTVTVPALPAGWTANSGWTTASTAPHTAPNHAAGAAGAFADHQLDSPTVNAAQLRFRSHYDIDDTFHGAVLEISVAGGPFTDILVAGGSFVSGHYTDVITNSFGNPLGDREAWSGNSGGYVDTIADLPPLAVGQDVRFRWRVATDNVPASGIGWRIDTIQHCSPPPQPFDYGDAPDPGYPTLSASNGAVHAMGGTLFLGPQVDPDADGAPSAAADGDDLDDANDDEDGVTLPAALIRGQNGSVTVNASVANGLLNAWLDFNQDGDWNDPNEHVFTDLPLNAGDNILSIPVPPDAQLGYSFARFRLSTQAGLSFDSPAIDGEVEDYRVVISSGGPELSISDAQIIEGHAGTKTLSFDVTLSQPSNNPISVVATTADASATALVVQRVASGLTKPVFATAAPGEPDLLFILEQTGRIKILDLQAGTINATPFMTIGGLSHGFEQGLLGLAFHPDYENNQLFYVYMTLANGNTLINEYQANPGGATADPAGARPILGFLQPFENHNGGWIDFGPDGYLYVASGDGGSANDPQQNAQDVTDNLLGKLLRIDVDGDDFPADSNRNYAIPPSNPFVGSAGDDEIWAYGLRNPWRNSFDRKTGDFYIADVGQNAIEEIDFQPAASPGGENYGWRLREGTTQTPAVGGPKPAGAIDPIYQYAHGNGTTEGFSVTGGYVYRGPIAELSGNYFFADYATERIWSLRFNGDAPAAFNATNHNDFTDWTDTFTPDVGQINDISSFGEDAAGNLYILDHGGEVFRVSGGADYLAKTQMISFAPQETSRTLEVAIIGDRLAEIHETFTVSLSAPVNAPILFGQATGTITNDDSPQVDRVVINRGEDQRSVVDEVEVTFNSIVDIDESGGSAFEFRNLDLATTVNHTQSISNASGSTVVTFNFVVGPSVEARGTNLPTLINGNYELAVVASRIGVTGLQLDGNADGTGGDDHVFTDSFFRKYGDQNGNAVVDLMDFADFRRTFDKLKGQLGFLGSLDSQGDDRVDLPDFAEFRRSFGT